MNNWPRCFLLVVGLLPAGRGIAAEAVRQLPAEAMIRFQGTSSLHEFGGKLPAQPFQLTLSNGTWTASSQVFSGQMLTDNAKRDRKMHEMMGTNLYPLIRGTVTNAPIPGVAGTNATLALKIRGTTQNLVARVMDWKEDAEAIRFRAKWELSLKQYGLKPPSVVGVIRVGDVIRLEADVTAKKSGSPPPPSIPRTP
jgi:polyisoprenoid-binding protein YceI